VNDGLTLWSVGRVDGEYASLYLGNPDLPGTEVILTEKHLAVRLSGEHNRQVQWARTTLAAEKAAGRPTMSRDEVEAALTRMVVAATRELASHFGPVKIAQWLLRSRRRSGPRPPAAAPMTERPTPPAA
jgi:hypothetical protein